MEYWINSSNKDNLIIFYNGWGLDEKPFLGLTCSDYDVIMFYDYNSIDTPKIEVKKYKKIYNIGYSFGVLVMSIIGKKVCDREYFWAINGNTKMISKEFGIRKEIFDATLKTIENDGVNKFYENIFKDQDEFKAFLNKKPERSLENQVLELKKLEELTKNNVIPVFDKALISKKDKIVFSLSQKRFCNHYNIKYKEIDSGHFPFFIYNSWDEIIEEFLNI